MGLRGMRSRRLVGFHLLLLRGVFLLKLLGLLRVALFHLLFLRVVVIFLGGLLLLQVLMLLILLGHHLVLLLLIFLVGFWVAGIWRRGLVSVYFVCMYWVRVSCGVIFWTSFVSRVFRRLVRCASFASRNSGSFEIAGA